MIGSQSRETGPLENNAMIWNIVSSRGVTGDQLAHRAALVLQELGGRYGTNPQFVSASVTIEANAPDRTFGKVMTKDPIAVRDLIRLKEGFQKLCGRRVNVSTDLPPELRWRRLHFALGINRPTYILASCH